MPRNIPLVLLAGVVTLSACGTPQERCIRRETREYRAVSELLAETEANLARGYAWREREYVDYQMDYCYRPVRRRDGRYDRIGYFCDRPVIETERYRVPIDPAAEERKRDYLAERLKALRGSAETRVQACKAAYPEAPKSSTVPAPAAAPG